MAALLFTSVVSLDDALIVFFLYINYKSCATKHCRFMVQTAKRS